MTAKRRDSNHQEIRDALRDTGLVTIDTGDVGEGFVDLVVIRRDGRVFLIEVKSDDGRMTKDEVKFVLISANPAYRIFYDAEQAIQAIWEE
jgi:hypothetical protein